jgi:predicted nucleic acid-binding protein
LADALIDSDVLIDALKGRASGAQLVRLSQTRELITSTVNVFEVCRGLTTPEAATAGRHLFSRFRILPFDEVAALRAAGIDLSLRRAGARIEMGDVCIAGIALANSLAIITRNVRHFSRVPGLELIELPS